MATIYDLIDRRTGNLVGSYDSRTAVAVIIQQTLNDFGIECLADLVLAVVDDDGNDRPMAFGEELVSYLLDGSPPPHSPYAPSTRAACTSTRRTL